MLLDGGFAHGWPDDQRRGAWVSADGYRLAATRPGDFVAVRAPLAEVPRDVIVSGTFQKVGGPTGGGYGLVVEDQGVGAGDGVDQSGQFIVAAVGDRGEIGIWQRDGVSWTDLVPWTPSSTVHADAVPNELSVQIVDGELTFLVNAAPVAHLSSVKIATKPPGRVGIFTGGDLNEVLVTRFRVAASSAVATAPVAPRQPAPESRLPDGGGPPSNAPTVQPDPSATQRVPELLAGIADEIGAIAASFAGGPNDPHDPVNDPVTLKEDAARLNAATSKAYELLDVMQRIRNGAPGGR